MSKQNKEKLKKATEDGINYKKVFFELMAVLTVLFIVVLVVLNSVFAERGVFNTDKYAEYKAIVEEVDNYDFSKGRDLKLEERLDKGYENTAVEEQAYFYALASLTYYCNIGYYNTAIEAYNWLSVSQLPDEKESLELEKRWVLCERKMASEEK